MSALAVVVTACVGLLCEYSRLCGHSAFGSERHITGHALYDLDPATGIHWAVASFDPTDAARQTSASVGFQDGGSQAVFMQPPGQPWQVESIGQCLKGLRVAVPTASGLNASPDPMCPNGGLAS
jgi:hypothetical protein